MKIIDNVNALFGDELKLDLKRGARLRIAASCFSIFAFEALRRELGGIDGFSFIFTEPAFTAAKATDGNVTVTPLIGCFRDSPVRHAGARLRTR